MASSKKRTTVPGSEKKAMRNAKVVGPVDPKEQIEITVVLRRRTSGSAHRASKATAEAAMDTGSRLPEQRQYLSREAFAAERGADPEDVAKVEAFAQEHKLTVIEASIPKRSIRLAGTIGDLSAAFEPNLKKSKVGRRTVRTRT